MARQGLIAGQNSGRLAGRPDARDRAIDDSDDFGVPGLAEKAEIRREIEEDVVRKTLWLDPATLDVTVTNGIVTLAGDVASAADAELLPTLTREVPGVVQVSSSLTHRVE